MAIPKQVKQQGSFYKGYTLAVSTTARAYTQVIVNTDCNYAMNGITVVPDTYGANDTMTLKHLADVAGTGKCLAILAEGIPNVGANMPINFDFPALQKVLKSECLVLYYTGSGTALNLNIIAEFAGITKTA